MAAVNDKFDVLRGWEPGGDASIDQSLPPIKVGGVPVTLLPGYIVALNANTEIAAATSPANVGLGTATEPLVYIVVEGNGVDTAPRFVEKVMCLRGKLTVKTDKLGPNQAFPVNGKVTYNNGLLMDHAPTATTHNIGTVLANDLAADGTVTVELDL
jgi:hypothetical protein